MHVIHQKELEGDRRGRGHTVWHIDKHALVGMGFIRKIGQVQDQD